MRPSGDCGAEAARAAPERTRARSTPPRRPSLVPSFSAGAERNTAPRASSSWAPDKKKPRHSAPRSATRALLPHGRDVVCGHELSRRALAGLGARARPAARHFFARRPSPSGAAHRRRRHRRRGVRRHPPRTPTSTPRCTRPCTRPTRGARGSRHSFPWTRAPRCWRSTRARALLEARDAGATRAAISLDFNTGPEAELRLDERGVFLDPPPVSDRQRADADDDDDDDDEIFRSRRGPTSRSSRRIRKARTSCVAARARLASRCFPRTPAARRR